MVAQLLACLDALAGPAAAPVFVMAAAADKAGKEAAALEAELKKQQVEAEQARTLAAGVEARLAEAAAKIEKDTARLEAEERARSSSPGLEPSSASFRT